MSPQTWDDEPLLFWYWANVADGGTTSQQYCRNISCLLAHALFLISNTPSTSAWMFDDQKVTFCRAFIMDSYYSGYSLREPAACLVITINIRSPRDLSAESVVCGWTLVIISQVLPWEAAVRSRMTFATPPVTFYDHESPRHTVWFNTVLQCDAGPTSNQ